MASGHPIFLPGGCLAHPARGFSRRAVQARGGGGGSGYQLPGAASLSCASGRGPAGGLVRDWGGKGTTRHDASAKSSGSSQCCVLRVFIFVPS